MKLTHSSLSRAFRVATIFAVLWFGVVAVGCGQISLMKIASNKLCAAGLNLEACETTAGSFVAYSTEESISASEVGQVLIPPGYYDGTKTCQISDSNLDSTNVRNDISLLGTIGTYRGSFNRNMASAANHDPMVNSFPSRETTSFSSQLMLNEEVETYVGSNFPTSAGYSYRDIPDVTKDDEGRSGLNCKYAARPETDCGLTESTIANRQANCAALNPTTSSWNGGVSCYGSEGRWDLVSRNGLNSEVWKDARTGLLWSSVLPTMNWCQASGNSQGAAFYVAASYNSAVGTLKIGNGTLTILTGGASQTTETILVSLTSPTTFTVSGSTCGGGAVSGTLTTTPGSSVSWSRAGFCNFVLTQGTIPFSNSDTFSLRSISAATYSCAPGAASGLQPASPSSACAEVSGLRSAVAGEDWANGIYSAAKGRMGKFSTPSVRWRLGSLSDTRTAEINGIRFVLPDAGTSGANRPIVDASTGGGTEWVGTIYSTQHYRAWTFSTNTTNLATGSATGDINTSRRVRCVGRGL